MERDGTGGMAPRETDGEEAAEPGYVAGYDQDELEMRPDMLQAMRSLKMLRGLCKEYGFSFRLPEGSLLDASVPSHRRRSAGLAFERGRTRSWSGGAAPEDGESSGGGSSSSWEFSSEDEQEAPPATAAIRQVLDGLQTDGRVAVLTEIDHKLSRSRLHAEAHLKELDGLECDEVQIRRQSSWLAEGVQRDLDLELDEGLHEVADEALLEFRAEDMPVARALQRCMAVVPGLRERALEKEEQQRREAKSRAEEEERRRAVNARAMEELENDTTIRGEVERRMRSLGDLPPDADPDLIKVLEAQRAEARKLVHEIQASEHESSVQRLALDYVDNKLNYQDAEDASMIEEAINHGRDLKAKLLAQRKSDAEHSLEVERRLADVPTEKEVKEAVKQQHCLQQEVERMADQVRRMEELIRQTCPDSAQEPGESEAMVATASTSSKKRRHLQTTEIALPVPFDKVSEVHPQMMKDYAEMERAMQEEEKAVKASETLLQNAEKTLKVVEECKILFLEQVARERPAAFEALFQGGAEDDDKSSLSASSEGGESGSAKEEAEDDAARLALGVEERWLRMQLTQFEPDEGGEGDDCATPPEGGDAEDGVGDDEGHQFDEVSEDLLKLAQVLEAEGAKATGVPLATDATDDPQDGDDSDYESPELKEVEGLSPEKAAERLRRLPLEEVRSTLRLQAKSSDLSHRIEAAKVDIEQLRYEQGATKELLGELGAASPPGADWRAPKAQAKVDPELLAEVQQKVQLLKALRLRWWKERQDPSTTVRRALATGGWPEGDAEDQPPARLQATIFERVYETMTLP